MYVTAMLLPNAPGPLFMPKTKAKLMVSHMFSIPWKYPPQETTNMVLDPTVRTNRIAPNGEFLVSICAANFMRRARLVDTRNVNRAAMFRENLCNELSRARIWRQVNLPRLIFAKPVGARFGSGSV